jgi:O-antigen/teichoic acid export membrane protein
MIVEDSARLYGILTMTIGESELIYEPQPPLPRGGRIGALLRRRATWVLIDQGCASAGNFLTANALGRYLSQSEFGVYGLLFETMLYLNSLQAALVIYPLLVRGATGDATNLGRLATAAIIFTFALLPILGAATFGSVAAVHSGHIAIAAIAAIFLWQLQETLRRGLIADLRYADAVWGDAVSYLGQAAFIFLLGRMGVLSLNLAFFVMAVTSAAAIGVQGMQIGLKRIRPSEIRSIARDFWKLGRWTLLTNGGMVITGLGYFWLLKWTHGLAEVAVYYSIVQLFKLANPIMISMSGLVVPAVARAASKGGPKSATRMALRYSAFGLALLLPYFLLLMVIPGKMLQLAWGSHSPYVSQANLLRAFIVNYCMSYVNTLSGAWLLGLGRARWNFYAQSVNIVATICIGLPLTAMYGAAGLVGGGMICAIAAASTSAYLLRKAIRSEMVTN